MTIVRPELFALLCCPACRADLTEMVSTLRCANGHLFPVVDGVPVFIDEGRDVAVRPSDHVSHQPSADLVAEFAGIDGPWLHLGAGATQTRVPGCVELETVVFRNTDVVADGACLPFRTGSLHGLLALNVFEHLPEPERVIAEIDRVLVPGAPVVVQTAFLQPLHADPGHFYNATEGGIRQWFRDFTIDDVAIPANFQPVFAFSWQAADLLYWSTDRVRPELEKLTLGELAEFWTDPTTRHGPVWEAFAALPPAGRRVLAAGFELRARSRGHHRFEESTS